MRTFSLPLLAALCLASTISAHSGPHHVRRAHGAGRARAWGRRDASVDSSTPTPTDTITDSPTPTSFPSVIPADFSTGEITISNTAAAAPQETAAAQGADRGDTTPLPDCLARGDFGSYCDPTTTDCCAIGTTCISNVCQRLCSVSTAEPYCDSDFPCDESLGYVCTSSRCRPPAAATHVDVGATCDQGSTNLLFCLPGKAICVDSVCQTCTQHS